MLIIFGTIMSMINGTMNPLACIVFGDLTDSFIVDARMSRNLSDASKLLVCLFPRVNTHLTILKNNHVFCNLLPLDSTIATNSTLQENMQV